MVAIEAIIQTINQISNIDLSIWAVGITVLLFLFLHGQRKNQTLAQLSIISGFIPVLIHELGHAVTASLTGAKVGNIYMVLTPRGQSKSGKQGYAEIGSTRWHQRALSAFMGYASPPLMLIIGIWLASEGLAILFIALLFILSLYYVWHTSQKWLPVLFIILIAYSGIDMVAGITELSSTAIGIAYSILLGLLAGEIIQSILITASVNFSRKREEWDGTAMRGLTFIPATVWWFIWAALGVGSLYTATILLL